MSGRERPATSLIFSRVRAPRPSVARISTTAWASCSQRIASLSVFFAMGLPLPLVDGVGYGVRTRVQVLENRDIEVMRCQFFAQSQVFDTIGNHLDSLA